MTDGASFPDYYDILGIKADASIEVIKQRYRELSLQCHPDKTANKETEKFVKLNLAYKILSHPDLKHLYDLQYVANTSSNITFHDSVFLSELEPTETAYVMQCRCGGTYELPMDATEIAIPEIVVCCNTCSLGISVDMSEQTSCSNT